MNGIVTFEEYSFCYRIRKDPTLKNVSLTIPKGKKTLIVGASGSGKSTLAMSINGLIPNSYKGEISGSLDIDGLGAGNASIYSLSMKVATVLQDPDSQFVALTAGEDIAFALENDMAGIDLMKSEVNSYAGLVGMQDFLDESPHGLSGGQKQRVSLAGAMSTGAKILLFDEPLANLDPKAGELAIALIDELAKTKGATTIIIEHRLEDALFKGIDLIVVMDEGQVVYVGSVEGAIQSGTLIKYGIREPLYISALRYSGIELSDGKALSSVSSLELCDDEIAKVAAFAGKAGAVASIENKNELLAFRDVSFSYGGKKMALSGANLSVMDGEVVAIVGSNGAGKSTLAKIACGFEIASSGSVVFRGDDITYMPIALRSRLIGYVMQNPNEMISKQLVKDEVAFGLNALGLPLGNADEALEACGLTPYSEWPISALSFGQKKRVTIASILSMKPEAIILDEPTAGQDYRRYSEIMAYIMRLNAMGTTVILITHDMHLMLEYADRAIVMHEGKPIFQGKPSQALSDLDVVEMASLKQTSLHRLASKCNLASQAEAFCDAFIAHERILRDGI
ncbi:MAG: ABC transporter ATP-binding protein [Eubacteriaceae bacterium]|nr:ABC transporter ATP-binding protein [Eubacteriaceae bacterium]